jgi:hypothetical protein
MSRLTRRQVLRRLGAAGAAAALGTVARPRGAVAQGPAELPRFLIVVAAAGGASIIDGPLAIRHGESPNWQAINAFPDAEVVSIPDSPFRAVDLQRGNAGAIPFPFRATQSGFVRKHKDDMLVVTHTGTSVNHSIAQKRSLTGNNAWNGRTLQEAVALRYGQGLALPNVNMAGQGYLEPGTDNSLPPWAFAEPVANPDLWSLSLHGSRGVRGAPDADLVAMARKVRDEKLDAESAFAEAFRLSPALKRWRAQREQTAPMLEGLDLVTRLNILPDQPPQLPLSDFGLTSGPDAEKVRAAFPRFLQDPMEAQAALAFLLLKNRVSVTVTLGPSFNVLLDGQRIVNPPLAYDFSHQAHRPAQAIMWDRLLGLTDRLIDLLKAEPLDEGAGVSFWDRSLLYVATEFGRSRRRQEGQDDFGSGHDLNNGSLLLSPMLKGNTVLGGVDPATGLTYGFDPQTGAPDPGRTMSEPHVFAGVLQALGIETPAGLPDMRAMRRA